MGNNILHMSDSRQIVTPAYVFSASEFENRAIETARILGPDIGLCYSMKANPFLLEVLPEEFSAVEVCSPGELEICIARGIPAEMIIYSGLHKEPGDIRRALEYGVGTITAESSRHLDMINKVSGELGIVSQVLIRISAGSQFGIDRKEAASLLAAHDKYPHLHFAGLHFFTGTQKRKPREIERELAFLKEYLADVRAKSGLELRRVEYGTGLPAYMFHDKTIDSLDDAFEVELQFLSDIAPFLQELSEISEVTVEMGRFFAASCGHYYTRVVDAKQNDGVNYAVVDGGSHQIRYFGQMQGMQIPFIEHISGVSNVNCQHSLSDSTCLEKCRLSGEGTGSKYPEIRGFSDGIAPGAAAWTICGSLCTTADVLARNAEFTDLEPGDILVFHQAGAYALYECMSLFLSRDMPRIYLDKSNFRTGDSTHSTKTAIGDDSNSDAGLHLVRNRVNMHVLNMVGDRLDM